MTTEASILIAGGGIAGLAAAIALAQHDLPVTVLESFDTPGEIGAGIQVPPNASHVLARLGLLEAVSDFACKPKSIRLGDASTGRIVLEMTVNRDAAGLPLLTVHRARLHRVLYAAAMADKRVTIRTGVHVGTVHQDGSGIVIEADGQSFRGSALIGADGVWSQVRRAVTGAMPARATGRIALRAVVPARNDRDASDMNVTAWMAPSAHCVTYPMRNSDTRNLVVTMDGHRPGAAWDNGVEAQTVNAVATTFARTPIADLVADAAWTSWPLNAVDPKAPWRDGRIVLIGDAAHALEPFGAQGAAMALEDAFTLAACMADNRDAPHLAFAAYETARRARIEAVARRTAFNRFTYHAAGPVRMARNAVFAMRPANAFLKDLDWLYEHRA